MTASAAMAAVSVRRMRGPSVAILKPAPVAAATSSAVKPPSGPISTATALAVEGTSEASGGASGASSHPDVSCAERRVAHRVAERRERRDLHQLGAARLACRLERDALPPFGTWLLPAGAPGGSHWDQAVRPQLRRFLHDEIHALGARESL